MACVEVEIERIDALFAGIGLGAGGLYLWAVMLDPSAPGDGLEKYYGQ